MQIHLSDISSSEGKSQHYSVAFEMDTITFQQGTFPVLAKEPVELTITNTGDRVLELEGSGLVTVEFHVTDVWKRLGPGFLLNSRGNST